MRTIMVSLALLAAGSVLTFAAANAGTARKPVSRTFQVALTGEAEAPTAGDPVATGTATIRLRAGRARVCYQIAARNLPRAIAAHIHRAKAGKAGNVVVPLKTPNASGNAKGCAKASKALVRSMIRNPGSYYVNVHTSQFPGGAIRGQLNRRSVAFGRIINRTLNGTTEPNATGTAVLRIRRGAGLICYRLTVENVTLPTVGAHIHRPGGQVAVPFTAPGASGTSDGCVTVEQSLIDEILGNLSGFYVNVHTREHPGGAIRAQLA